MKLRSFSAVVLLPGVATLYRLFHHEVPVFEYETRRLEHRQLSSTHGRLFQFDSTAPALLPGQCKPRPGDFGWPAQESWDALDQALGGALIKTVPLAAPCHDGWGVYDAEKCRVITSHWTKPELHDHDPTSVMWPLWEGRSCLPTDSPANSSCTLGGYPVYAVNATTVAHVQLAVNFARNLGLRLVVKNTGHDYQGRSSGAGALSIWTHNLKDLRYFSNLTLQGFSGHVLHVGAGVQTLAISSLADSHGASVVAGMCASVGFAGGYFAGGGHSPLSGAFGLAADHILAINVVTPDGRFITATHKNHADLFWALRGGGGSTFGVTTSVVVRLLPRIPTTTLWFSFTASGSVSNETFWQGVRAVFGSSEDLTRAGIMGYMSLRRNPPLDGNASYSLSFEPFMAPNISAEALTSTMKPITDQLNLLGIPYKSNMTSYASYHSAWLDTWPPDQLRVAEPNSVDGSWLFTRQVLKEPGHFNKSLQAIQQVVEEGYDITGFVMAPRNPYKVENAASASLRNNVIFVTTSIVLSQTPTPAQLRAAQDKMMNGILQSWREAAPTDMMAGSYSNEGNVGDVNWRQDLFGANYNRLLQIKRRVDPSSLFYVPAGVGSEEWEVPTAEQGIHTQNGPLCKRNEAA
ncbi:hypothetical protein CDD82_811 [Ophiocordyceps australis]|uniref:FAD-binding PCMH-type domain-containing protein n=1 Tax=Ophiocordyceps australis TaxID=1399860 RepID=A0A2C5YKV8_9HYPO|nr:hypothetical protein CDD82_811 [Ophiocordyceps australis]